MSKNFKMVLSGVLDERDMLARSMWDEIHNITPTNPEAIIYILDEGQVCASGTYQLNPLFYEGAEIMICLENGFFLGKVGLSSYSGPDDIWEGGKCHFTLELEACLWAGNKDQKEAISGSSEILRWEIIN